MNNTSSQQSDREKVVLITGANKGLGREIARQLGSLGMTVVASARDEGRGQRTAEELQDEGADVRFLHLDVTDEHSVRRAAEHIDEEFGRLDVLINNAGITVDAERPSEKYPSTESRPSVTTGDQVQQTYAVNVIGVVRVIHATLPLLHRSPAARVVNMSSPLGSLTFRADPDHPVAHVGLLAYSSSKAALNAITLLYANELRDTGILINAANPGKVATDLNAHTGERTVEQGATIAVHLATLDDNGPTGVFLSDNGPVPW